MNARMIQTELYKICAKRVIWMALAAFLALFLVLNLQFFDAVGVKYTLEPMRAELTQAMENEELHRFIREGDYQRTAEELRPYLPAAVFDHIEQYRQSERIARSLTSDLARILNNYCERIDARRARIEELERAAAAPEQTALTRAKAKLLQAYRNTPVTIELNLESSANHFIDVNHSALFPGSIMLIVLVGLAGSYADEYTSGTLSPMLTSRKGRKGVFFSKLAAAGIFICFIVLLMEAFYMAVTAICCHAPNTAISAASTYGLSLTPYGGTVAGFCARQISGTLLAAFALGSATLCLSAYSKNALIPFFAAGIYYGVTALYANSIPFPPYCSTLWSLPGELSLFMLQTQVELVQFGHYTSVFGWMIPTLALNAGIHTVLTAVCLALCYRGYTRKQVRD